MYTCNLSAGKGLRPSWVILWTNDPSLLIRVAFLGLFRPFSLTLRGFTPISQVQVAPIRGRWNWLPGPNIQVQSRPPPNVDLRQPGMRQWPNWSGRCSEIRCLCQGSSRDGASKLLQREIPNTPTAPLHLASRQCPPRPGWLQRGARQGGRGEATEA